MKRLIAIAAITMLVPATSQATHTVTEELYDTGTYDVTVGVRVGGTSFGYTDPDNRIGGALFEAPGLKPVRVVVNDAGKYPVGISAAQDFNNNGIAGQTGEPNVLGCGGSLSLASSAVPFDPNRPVWVFVRAIDTQCGATNLATSGSVELYVEVPVEH